MSFPPPTAVQARLIWAAITGLALAALVGVVVALIWGLGQVLGILAPVLWPLAVAGVIAYLLDPVVDYLERKRVPRTRAILFVFVLALMLVTGVIGSVVPRVVVETRELVQKVPDYASKIHQRVERWINDPPRLVRGLLRLVPLGGNTNAVITTNPAPPGVPAAPTRPTPPAGAATGAVSSIPLLVVTNREVGAANGSGALAAGATNRPARAANDTAAATGPQAARLEDLIELARSWGVELDPKSFTSATGWITGLVQKVGSWVFGQVGRVASWFGMLVGMFLIPIYAFYFLQEKRAIQSKWAEYLPLAKSHLKDELAFVIGSINDYLIAFFRGQVLVAICDGVLYAIGFSLIGLPYAMLLGVVATALTLIPYIGAAITFVSALILAFVQYTDWLHPLLALGVYAVVQLLEGFVIQPKIMGERVGLHPLTIIIAVITGTTLLGGILGGILAIPLTAALRVLMFRYVWRRRPPVHGRHPGPDGQG
jgi:predicted PurR-regulated permease PerM